MSTYIEPSAFVAAVLAEAKAHHWELELAPLNVPMRFRYRWTWRGLHPLPEELILTTDLDEARLRACLDLVGRTGWAIAYEPKPGAIHLALEPVTGLGVKVSLGRPEVLAGQLRATGAHVPPHVPDHQAVPLET